MRRTERNLSILQTIFVVSLVISNVVTAKLFYTGVVLFGVVVTLPGAALCYAITYLATDIIGEIWGKKEANQTVLYGFIGQLFATALIILTRYIPAADPAMQEAYISLLGQNHVFVIGSLAGYLASQSWDVMIFHRLRNKYAGSHYAGKRRWIWNNGSTLTSQIIDTVLFIGISFGLGFGWLFDKTMWPSLAAMMVGQYVFKAIIALVDTPFFYFFTRRDKHSIGGKRYGDTTIQN